MFKQCYQITNYISIRMFYNKNDAHRCRWRFLCNTLASDYRILFTATTTLAVFQNFMNCNISGVSVATIIIRVSKCLGRSIVLGYTRRFHDFSIKKIYQEYNDERRCLAWRWKLCTARKNVFGAGFIPNSC